MLNTDDFIKRLELILDFYSLSASAFADKIGVQRSGLSHLLSGRNKPSLDFILKIVEHFPEVDLQWILTGKGNAPGHSVDLFAAPSPATTNEKPVAKLTDNVPAPTEKGIVKSGKASIQKIVIFYSDGTFSEYDPQMREPSSSN